MAIAPTGPGMVAEAENAAAEVGAAPAQPWPSEGRGWFALFAIIFATFITFFDQTKLNGEPIKPPELLELLVRCNTCTVADELRKISKISICEHWDMSDRLVDDIRLRCIFRFRMVSDVLGR